MGKKLSWLIGLALLAVANSAQANLITFFGENLNPSGAVSGAPLTAHDDFLSALSSGVGTENFESFAPGQGGPLTLTFPGSTGNIMATLTGAGGINSNGVCCGRFATSGSNIWEGSGQFSIDFSSPIAAFGFYGTDIGDFNGSVTLTLAGGGTTNLTIPHTVNGPSGSLLFYGFIDNMQTYTSVTFGNTATGTDFFGFDDMTIGDIGQVTGKVPEPGTLALFGAGLAGMGFAGRRRKTA